jgi:hypothetical protein
VNKTPWLVAGGAVVALAAVLASARSGATAHGNHPKPRDGVTAEHVLTGAAIPRTIGAVEAYAAARAVPATLDGVYCHCDCSEHAGHRSLLTCFESDHGAFCDICMGEAVLAAQLTARGTSLQDIRAAIDRQFGS